MDQRHKFNFVEAFFMVMLALLADAAEALGNFVAVVVPGLGLIVWIVTWLYGFCTSLALLFWIIMKGVRPVGIIGGGAVDLIPGLNALPARTAGTIFTITQDWAPGSLKKLTGFLKK